MRTRILYGLLLTACIVALVAVVDGVLDRRRESEPHRDVRHVAASSTGDVGVDATARSVEAQVPVGATAGANRLDPHDPPSAIAEDPMPDARPAGVSPSRRPLPTTAELARSGGGPGVSDDVRAAMDRMAMDFATDLEPTYQGGRIDGIRAANISDGGLLDEAGVDRDDVIRELNGVKVDNLDAAQRILRDLARCQPMTALVSGAGGDRTVEITGEMLRKFSCVE